MKIEVIKPGILIRNEKGFILNAASSVTLIQTENKNIIIDTSVKKAKKQIITELKKRNLTPSDIDIVFNTHLHHDHVLNNSMFENSKKFINEIELIQRKRRDFIPIHIEPNSSYKLAKKVELISTPGHTLGSTSVVVNINNKNYVITGDAIPIKGNFFKWVPPIINVDRSKCLNSMKKIRDIADFIIPGHDVLFGTKA